ncbi:MAG: putative bifunctional diguanylate cyclase/phosphodiesterase [Burkholderiales bacterium]
MASDPDANPGAAEGDVGRIQAELTEKERILSLLMDNLEGMVYRCLDDAHWTMQFVSAGALALTGYEPGELVGNAVIAFEQLEHPDDRVRVRAAVYAGLKEQRRFQIEYRIQCRDGSVKWVMERGSGVFDETGTLVAIEGFIEDITEHRLSIDALRETERHFRSIFEHATEGIFQTTPDGRYLNVNPALARIYGYDSPRELMDVVGDIGRQVYVEPKRRDEFVGLLQEYGSVANFVSEIFRKDGSKIWVAENARVVRGERDEIQHFEGTVVDVSATKRYEEELVHLANHDALTSLPNRIMLNDRLRQMLLHATRGNTVVAVAFVDLDNFKLVNDSLGHNVGDQLLMTMAERMQACLRETDTVARLGGDEFVLLLSGERRGEAMGAVIRRVLTEICAPCSVDGHELNVSASIGIAVFPRDGRDVGTLLKNADTAMYRAKENGRNNFQFYTAEMNAAVNVRIETEASLRRAVERNEFVLHFQPKVDLGTRRIVGSEALIRWQHPQLGLVGPLDFIGIAEETGLIVPIGEWVLNAACAYNQSLQDAGLPPLRVAVNLSARQFRGHNITGTVRRALAHSGMLPKWLELELTESVVMHDAGNLISTLEDLASIGCKLSVDDFGTGYSSLSYLKRFPVANLKIDKSFVRDITTDADDAAIVKAIIVLGHSLELSVTAEGVENEGQLRFLAKNGCDEVQGNYFGEAMPGADLQALLQAQLAPSDATLDGRDVKFNSPLTDRR